MMPHTQKDHPMTFTKALKAILCALALACIFRSPPPLMAGEQKTHDPTIWIYLGRPYTMDEALEALDARRNHRKMQRTAEFLANIEKIIPDPEIRAVEKYGAQDGIKGLTQKLAEEELRVVYAFAANWASTNNGALPQSLAGMVLPGGIDATQYRLLGVGTTNGLAKDVMLCVRSVLWTSDGVNIVHPWRSDGRTVLRMTYAEYLARTAAGEELRLDDKIRSDVPETTVLTGDGRVWTVGKPRFVELLAADAAARAKLGSSPAPPTLLEDLFGEVDERIYDIVPKFIEPEEDEEFLGK